VSFRIVFLNAVAKYASVNTPRQGLVNLKLQNRRKASRWEFSTLKFVANVINFSRRHFTPWRSKLLRSNLRFHP